MTSSKARRKRRRLEVEADERAKEAAAEAEAEVAPAPAGGAAVAPAPGRSRLLLLVVAATYLVTVWLDGIGSNLPVKLVPRVWLYFSQVAALFKGAGIMAIDYRAEGWSCSEKRWVEVDVLPFFKIDADNKENRFHRALQFYRKERKVMRALEDYVVKSNNATPGRETIAGVRFLSLRIPYPELGSHVDHVARKPLAEYPEEMRHPWYWTPMSKRRERCGEAPAAGPDDDDKPPPRKASPKADDKANKEGDPEP